MTNQDNPARKPNGFLANNIGFLTIRVLADRLLSSLLSCALDEQQLNDLVLASVRCRLQGAAVLPSLLQIVRSLHLQRSHRHQCRPVQQPKPGAVEKALGKVLFIDEAYRLAKGHFAKEAMDEVVDSITKPKFAQKLIIILAGYDADINRLMSINPGLTSRFPEPVVFWGLTPDECVRLLTQLLQGQKHKLLEKKADLNIMVLESPRNEFLQGLLDLFKTLSRLPNWANARDIQTLAKGVFGRTMQFGATSSTGKLNH